MPAGIFSRPDAHARREEVPGPDQVPPRLGDAPSSGGIVPRVELAPPARASSQTKLHFFYRVQPPPETKRDVFVLWSNVRNIQLQFAAYYSTL